MFERKSSYKVLLRSSFPSPALWPKPKREQRAPLGMLWESSAMQGKVRPTQTKVSNDALGTDAADFLCFGCFLTCMCMWVFVGVCVDVCWTVRLVDTHLHFTGLLTPRTWRGSWPAVDWFISSQHTENNAPLRWLSRNIFGLTTYAYTHTYFALYPYTYYALYP